MITDAKVGRCVILTTHSMEEVEVLSDRIGIMALGMLRCLGSPLHLKSKYGKGFRVTISFDEKDRAKVGGGGGSLAATMAHHQLVLLAPLWHISRNYRWPTVASR